MLELQLGSDLETAPDDFIPNGFVGCIQLEGVQDIDSNHRTEIKAPVNDVRKPDGIPGISAPLRVPKMVTPPAAPTVM